MKKILVIITACMLAFSVDAQLLWRVSGNGSKKDSFLFGTHHIAPASMIDSVAGLRAAIAVCDTVYGEVRDTDMLDVNTQQALMSIMMAPADSTLTALMTSAQCDSVNSILAKYIGGALTVGQLAMLKPAAVATQLAMMQAMVAFPDFDPAAQIDMAVQRVAKELGKPTQGFETALWQAELLYGNAISEQLTDLMQTVAKDDRAAEFARRLAAAYMQQNLSVISDLINDPEMGSTEAEMNRLIYNRNAAWVQVLMGLLPTSAILVCVGIGHLSGERGLINLLRTAGYKVDPIE
jgi:hypothetical protein